MAICLLDENTINQIAAGEVIERPMAVVKELMENAVDAHATIITVEIKDGGLSYIRITDNGSGIPREEVPIAFWRHSTSKIRTAQDLLQVKSLGFRGEALSSIASVAQVELITKTEQEEEGSCYRIEGGVEKSLQGTGCPTGTTFVVRNLFYHTPARRKFLKTPTTEAGYVADIVERMALSHPEIAITFLSNDQKKLQTSGNGSTKDAIYQIFGREITRELIPVEKEDIRCGMQGFVGKPVLSRGNRNYMNYFINGRYIKSPVIQRAIEDAYKPYTMLHRYPFAMLSLRVDTDCIDVNVHPTKMEIRFSNQEEIYRMVFHTLEGALREPELIPKITLSPETMPEEVLKEKQQERKAILPIPTSQNESASVAGEIDRLKNLIQDSTPLPELFRTRLEDKKPAVQAIPDVPKALVEEQHSLDKKVPMATKPEPVMEPIHTVVREHQSYEKAPVPKQESFLEEPFITKEHRNRYRVIGQVFGTYWMIEFDNRLLLMDQHAAHEKILYEKLSGELTRERVTTQSMNPPVIVTLSMKEEETLSVCREIFYRVGFEIESFGGKEYAITAVPAYLPNLSMNELFVDLLDDLVEKERYQNSDYLLAKVASMSCKAAVKGNFILSHTEAEALIDQLMDLEHPYHCPHGRPTMIEISKSELERKFKRQIGNNTDHISLF